MIKSAAKNQSLQVFKSYLQSATGKLNEYTVEVQQDQLLIKSSKGMVKMQLQVNDISPFSGG